MAKESPVSKSLGVVPRVRSILKEGPILIKSKSATVRHDLLHLRLQNIPLAVNI